MVLPLGKKILTGEIISGPQITVLIRLGWMQKRSINISNTKNIKKNLWKNDNLSFIQRMGTTSLSFLRARRIIPF